MHELPPATPQPTAKPPISNAVVRANFARVEIANGLKEERWVLDNKIDVSRTFDNV